MFALVLTVALVAVTLCAVEVLGVRYRRLAYQRRNESFRDFQAYFRRAGVHADVMLATQEYFQAITSVRAFPVRPTDDLLAVYGLHDEDIHDAVAVVAAGAHCLTRRVLDPDTYTGVSTVEDLVLAVQRLHEQQQAARLAAPALRRAM
jgi:hypothetical protein